MTAAELRALGLGRESTPAVEASRVPRGSDGGGDGGRMRGLGAPPPRPQYEGKTLSTAARQAAAQQQRDWDEAGEFVLAQAPRPFGAGVGGGQRLHPDALAAVYEASGVPEEEVPELMRRPVAVAAAPWSRAARGAALPENVFAPTVESGEEGEGGS